MQNLLNQKDNILGLSREKIISAFVDVTVRVCRSAKVRLDDVLISKVALATALNEAEKDVYFLKARRNNKKGDSESKIAGAVVFRLCRSAPVHLQGDSIENELALELNNLSALAVGLKIFMHMDVAFLPETITRELSYTIVRRHMNQETLGLVFESVKTLLESSKTLAK